MSGRNHDPAPLKVWRHFLPGDWEVLAGKTDEDNDRLSLQVASPDDWWFHVRGMPGSHVILRANEQASGKQTPSRGVLKQAAAIAAYYSKGRSGGMVAVSATQATNVSKPRGAKPGTVSIRREIVLKVRPGLPAQPLSQPPRKEP